MCNQEPCSMAAWREIPLLRMRKSVDVDFHSSNPSQRFNAILLTKFCPARSGIALSGHLHVLLVAPPHEWVQSLQGNTVQRKTAVHKSMAGHPIAAQITTRLLFGKGTKAPCQLRKRPNRFPGYRLEPISERNNAGKADALEGNWNKRKSDVNPTE